jgi:two-component system LytT family response regulator
VERLRVALVDDEATARKRLARLLEALPNVEIVGAFESAQELLNALPESQADVVLLDIQMPDLNGLDASALIDGPYVIFVTAHSEHALTAFDRGALDYILKPVDAARLKRAIERAARVLGRTATHDNLPERLAITTLKGVTLLDPQLITYAVYDGQLVTLHTADKSIVTAFTLAELEARIPDGLLMRVHRRYLLNLAKVERLEALSDGGYTAITHSQQSIPIARQAARVLRKRLNL